MLILTSTIMEMLSIAVAAMVFSIAWVTQKYRLNGRALVLGIGLLGVALLDLSHALSYAGMPDFITPSGPEKAINFWLAARAMAAAALLWAALWPEGWSGWLNRRGRYLSLLAMGAIAIFIMALLFFVGLGSIAFLYFGSEVLLAVAVQLAFSYTASNAAVKIAKGGWLGSVWRITWKPMLGSLLCAVALGFMFDTFVPNANTMVDVVRILQALM